MDGEKDADLRKLTGRWVHAHEEDRLGTKVYRSEGVALPPSRGRSALDIRSDGTVIRQGIGADDRSGGNATAGVWTLDPDDGVELVFHATRAGAESPPVAPSKFKLRLDLSDPTRLIEER